MKYQWDLKELFPSDDVFFDEIKKIRKELETFLEPPMEITKTNITKILKEYWDIKERCNRVLVYGSLRYYKNVKDEMCIQMKREGEALQNEVNTKLMDIDRLILALGKEMVFDWIYENSELEIYQLFLDNLFRKEKHIPDEKNSLEIKKYQEEWNHMKNEYSTILQNIDYGTIIVNEENVSLSSANFSKYLSSRDRKVRKDTYFTVNQEFIKHGSEFASLFDTVFQDKASLAKLEGYSTVLESALFEENIDSKILDTLIMAVHEALPLLQKYLKLKAQILEITDPHLYDFGVPLDFDNKRKYTIEEGVEIIKEALKPLGEQYLEVVDMLLHGHIDAELSNEKHQSITFSWNSYSFLNFHGAYGDLKNLVHELGHSVNDYLSYKNVPFMYMVSTVFVGEISSIVNEILLNRYLYQEAETKEEKIYYLSKEIENYVTSVFKQTMYTEFERELHQLRKNGPFTQEILSETFLKLVQTYYGEGICYDEVSSIEWTRLGHLIRHSYYSYTYATGLLMASVVVHSLIDEQTLTKEEYIKFLASGSSMYSLPLLETIGIDMTDSTIIENGFKVLEEDILKLEKLLK